MGGEAVAGLHRRLGVVADPRSDAMEQEVHGTEVIVDVIRPRPNERICDPACGTGGFLLAAHDYIAKHHPNLDREQKRHLKLHALRGYEIVDSVTRLLEEPLVGVAFDIRVAARPRTSAAPSGGGDSACSGGDLRPAAPRRTVRGSRREVIC